jgi:hypothetical protein
MMPKTAHWICPVMKLPGKMLIPWKNQTPPMRMSKTASRFNINFIVCAVLH